MLHSEMCTESIQILDVSISPFHHQRIQPLWRFFCGVPMLPVNGQPFLLRACVLTSIGHIMAYIFWYIHWLVIWSFLEMKLIRVLNPFEWCPRTNEAMTHQIPWEPHNVWPFRESWPSYVSFLGRFQPNRPSPSMCGRHSKCSPGSV